jgi:hypothetical protein
MLAALFLTSCTSPEQTAEQFEQNTQRAAQMVELLKQAGVECKVFARLKVDKIGSFEQTINGPGEFEIIIVGEAEPDETRSSTLPSTFP